MFMSIVLIIVFVLAVILGSVPLPSDSLRRSELIRRAKHSAAFKKRLERDSLHVHARTMLDATSIFVAILFTSLTVVAYGWLGGVFVSCVAAVLYVFLVRQSGVRTLSARLFQYVDPYVFAFARKVPPVWKFLRITPKHPVADTLVLSSREELEEAIALSADALSHRERQLLGHVLAFNDKKVRDVMTPRSVIRTVNRAEFLGPLVLDELHNTGHGRLPVIDGDIDHVVGILHLRDLLSLENKKSAIAEALMEKKVFYVNEDTALYSALASFIRHHHHLFIVVNNQRETVGLLTLEDVIEALIGEAIVDEDDQNTDMRKKAAQKAGENNNSPHGIYL